MGLTPCRINLLAPQPQQQAGRGQGCIPWRTYGAERADYPLSAPLSSKEAAGHGIRP